MRNILDEIKLKAKALQKTIVLCEGEDNRVVKAAADATKEGVAKIVLLGDEEAIKAANPDIDLTGVTIVNPLTSNKLPEYTAKLCELRASKGMTPEQAAYNKYAPILMTSVDTEPDLCRRERTAILQRLGAGDWQIFGAHGMKKDYRLKIME